MHICIDISQIIYEGTGVARFTYQLAKTILALKTPHRFTFFFSSLKHDLHADLVDEIHTRGHTLLRWHIPPRLLSPLWNYRILGKLTPIPGFFDAFISSDWTQPPPQVAALRATVVHDLIFKEHPETVDPLILNTQEKRLSRVQNECQIIWCDSMSTKKDFEKYYPRYAGQITINYPGFLTPSLPPEASLFPFVFKPYEYFFAVGKIEPRKNIPRLIEAFLKLIATNRYSYLHLAIAGPRGCDIDAQQYKHPHIHYLGTVDDAQLALLYQQALAFVFPTLYEGFGIPPLEAMSLGCPVILSNTSSLPEIASPQSALFINPTETDQIYTALKKLASEHTYRKELIQQGYKNVVRFDWNTYVKNMLESLENAFAKI